MGPNDNDPGQYRHLARTKYYRPDTRMPKHRDGQARLSLVLSGQIRETAGRREAQAEAFSVALKSAEAEHATRIGPNGASIASIDLDAIESQVPGGFSIEAMPHWCWVPGRVLRFETGELLAAMVDFRRQSDWPESRDGLREAVLLLVDRVCAGRPSGKSAKSPWADSVRAWIDEAPDEPVSVATLADRVEVSPTHLTRRFRSAFGMSVTAYRNLRRIQLAVERLADPSLSLIEIASDCGFHDQSHLTHHSRRLTGTMPAVWRHQLLAA